MVKVTFIEADGNRHDVEAKTGEPLMYAARDAGVAGIIAECGGSAMCATCHCYVIEAAEGALAEPRQDELDTIEFMANEPRDNSRLPCQVIVTPDLEGAVFEVATGQ
ncbi:ferredoxin [Zhengella mangrovi]|uniref:Ferredoxin n=1 Tax=Zhengella mangrovi TaxID=1982044 RepID=A0A2G1QRU8_9HYPH|nr:2Fe-2S iron-sulfur cluster-binding protein [Zhengella mangrovi]PHP67928.1 ferredoxin [Zhengella mangrovi]